jgi:hypothetical protein
MMRTFLLAVLVGIPGLAPCKDKPDARLMTVTTVFVAGNNQAAEKARATLRNGKTCLALATKADAADATLDISAESQTMGGMMGGFGGRNWVASGTLTLKSGDLIWSYSSRFGDAPGMSGGKTTGELIVKHLADDAGCKQRKRSKD